MFGLKALWRVMLGRRKNILKARIESYHFNNGQLYLATMFFAALLFLLPTISIYYIVFASVSIILAKLFPFFVVHHNNFFINLNFFNLIFHS